VKRLIAAAAILAVVLVVGCQDTKKVTELQGTIDKQVQQITDLTTQVQKLTVEKDSLVKFIADQEAKMPAAKKPGRTGGNTGGGQTNPPGKPPRTGR
jgi:outer membrane murein-binding lipoprotein Lpp